MHQAKECSTFTWMKFGHMHMQKLIVQRKYQWQSLAVSLYYIWQIIITLFKAVANFLL